MNKNSHKFLVSVIIPVYNVQEYIRETIESVINQDLGFTDYVEIILVNDGSPDESGVICEEYANRYPQNIKYIKQENSGVSEARNNGLQHVSGKYIHFLDSDDLISKNTYTEAVKVLDENEDRIDFAAIKIEFFDARIGGHPLNYKFNQSRIIDIDKEPSAVIMHLPTCIIRRAAIDNKFIKSIQISEDSRFINEILLKKRAYAVISNSYYYYRKRSGGGSAIDDSTKKVSFYTITPIEVYRYLMVKWSNSAYIQNLVAYDLQWRINQKKQTVLSPNQQAEYKEVLYSLIRDIDSDIFISQKSIGFSEKEFILKIKEDDTAIDKLRSLYSNDKRIVAIDLTDFSEDKVTLTGHVPTGTQTGNLEVHVDGQKIKVDKVEMFFKRNEFLGDTIYDGGGFTVDIPLTSRDVKFFYDGAICEIVTKRHSRIPSIKNGYTTFAEKMVINNKVSISIKKVNRESSLRQEALRQLRILAGLKLRYSAEELYRVIRVTLKSKLGLARIIRPFMIPIKSLGLNIRDVGIRNLYFIYRRTKRKPVWILSDRITAAGDNGEALFRYLANCREAQERYDIYFCIDKNSEDYYRLRSIGKVVNRFSFKYKLLFLCADKIISSHAEDNIYNAFEGRYTSFIDLYRFDFVFLQHGIIKDDLSSWINKYAKNVKLFITSTPMERSSITSAEYGYKQEEVVLTGLPRYDLLKSNAQKKLIIMPTWRASLVPSLNQKTGRRDYSEIFKDSEFYSFYNKLIHDARLLESLSKNDYTGEFYLHPSLSAQINDFSGNDKISIIPFPHEYKDVFSTGAILLTDYSSVAFDFAYMKKPVIYTQFDEIEFFEGQPYSKGYFSYKDDGFGPVVNSYEDTVSELINLLNNDADMSDKYKGRVSKFFKYTDTNNSRRVYEAIVNIGDYGGR